MKRIFFPLLFFVLSISVVYAQGEMDAYKFSRNDLTGTARSVSMGGAFGALGGDISGISINPAGIGVYKSSEIVTTLNFENARTKTNLNDGEMKESKFKFNFDNLAFVSSIQLNNDVAPILNIGFSYNRLKNFNKRYSTRGTGHIYSLADYMALRASEGGYNDPDKDLYFDPGKNDPFAKSDWLAAFGYSGYLIDYIGDGEYDVSDAVYDNTSSNNLYVQEKGSVNTYDFNIGTTFSDIISAGLTIAITDIDYRLYSEYKEWIGTNTNNNGFDLYNSLKTQGTGWQIKTGIIVKPIQELRFGISYHSPTWYNMTDYASAGMNYDMSYFYNEDDAADRIRTGDAEKDYKFRSPDKWTFSAASVIGNIAILSVDYELTNYKNNMKLYDRWGDPLADRYIDPNTLIKQDFKNTSTVRVGAEVRATPQLSIRAGYAWIQSPLSKQFKNNDFEVVTVGSTSHYALDGDLNNFTYGLGYRFSRNFYMDIAFVMSSQKSDLYAFPKGFDEEDNLIFESTKSSLKTNKTQGLLTLGYKF